MSKTIHKLIAQATAQDQATCHWGSGQLRTGWISDKDQPAAHRHRVLDAYHMLFLIHGQGQFVDPKNQSHPLTAGTLLHRPPDLPHTIERYPDGQWVEFYITLSRPIFNAMIEMGILSCEYLVHEILVTPTIIKNCITFVEQFHQIQNTSNFQKTKRVIDLFDTLQNIPHPTNTFPHPIQHAADLLTNMQYQDVPLPEIAEKVGMGYETFRKKFHDSFGVSAQQYRIQHRIEQAQYRLLESDMSIEQLATSLGYVDVFSFSRQFKAYSGISPTAYRKTQR